MIIIEIFSQTSLEDGLQMMKVLSCGSIRFFSSKNVTLNCHLLFECPLKCKFNWLEILLITLTPMVSRKAYIGFRTERERPTIKFGSDELSFKRRHKAVRTNTCKKLTCFQSKSIVWLHDTFLLFASVLNPSLLAIHKRELDTIWEPSWRKVQYKGTSKALYTLDIFAHKITTKRLKKT